MEVIKIKPNLKRDSISFKSNGGETSKQLVRFFNFQNLKNRFLLTRIEILEDEDGFTEALLIAPQNSELFVEDIEMLSKHLFSIKLFNFIECVDLINQAALLLDCDSQASIVIIGKTYKMRMKIEDNHLVISPIFDTPLLSIQDFHTRVKDFCLVMRSSVESFIRYNIKFLNNCVMLEFNEVIDQLFYILKKFFKLPQVLSSATQSKDAMIEVAAFIAKRTAQTELSVLSGVIEANSDHILSQYRYVGLRTFQFFNGLAQHGRLDKLSDQDVKLLHDALTLSGLFNNIPPIMLRSFNRLRKIVPFRSLENIVVNKKKTEYAF